MWVGGGWWVVGGWVVEGKFSVTLWSKPYVKALDLDLDQAEQYLSILLLGIFKILCQRVNGLAWLVVGINLQKKNSFDIERDSKIIEYIIIQKL